MESSPINNKNLIDNEINDYLSISKQLIGRFYKVNGFIFKGVEGILPAKNKVSTNFSKYLFNESCDSALDVGCGSGILSFTLALKAKKVVATDNNPTTIQNAKLNAKLNRIDNIHFSSGHAFEPVNNQQFDLIVCNPPFYKTNNQNDSFNMLCYSNSNNLLKCLLIEIHKYLTVSGKFIFVTSSFTDNSDIQQLLNSLNLSYSKLLLCKGKEGSQDILLWETTVSN